MSFVPDIPGRDCWKLKGGLLPSSPGSTGKVGYYRLNVAPEKSVGSAWLKGDTSDSTHCVNQGVKVLQAGLNSLIAAKLVVDGDLGPKTDVAIRKFQTVRGLVVDGVAGPATMRELFRELIAGIASARNVPVKLLFGLLYWESGLDPAGVGVNGWDHGVAQINLDPASHGNEITWDEAMDPAWAIDWAARELRATHDRWVGKTAADPKTGVVADAWDIAIANHNSPALAQQWAKQGFPPVVFHADGTPRVPQIGDYVADVKRAG